ncbi:MAG: Binding-protein-dependent transport system inner rane component, partial [Thermomicrobiales bacterium]|nr:Binding-protein-dependent transport system inner rane component [Thermomicrobiales bacterium]
DPLAAYTMETALSREDIARLRAYYGLDQPVYVQYLNWLGNLARGDWGTSYVAHKPVLDLILQRLPNTLMLVAAAYTLILTVSIVLGIYTAIRQYSWVDHLVTGLAFVGISIPSFWLGLILLVVFAVGTRNLGLPYFPAGGMYDLSVGPTVPQVLWHLVLPAVTLATVVTANYIRYIRASMLEVLHNDYVRTARAKGLHNGVILRRHAFRNAAIPLVTLIGLDLPRFLSGSLVVEAIFAWPGLGRLFWEHAERTDIPVLMAIMMLTAAMVVFFNLLADVAYAFLDPRIRYG